MTVSKRKRYEVLRRDNHTCKYCGAKAPDVTLQIDHVVPDTLGGSDDPSNLVAACRDCNAGKSASNPDAALVADVDEKAAEWGRAMSRVLEQRGVELADERARLDAFDRRWRGWTFAGQEMPRDPGWRSSVAQFLAAGLDDQWLADTVDKVVGLDKVGIDGKWKYFCGTCWGEINQLIERATQAAAMPTAPIKAKSAELRDPPFDYMAMYEVLLEELVQATGAQPIIFKDVKWLVGMALPDAHQVWKASLAANDGDTDVAEEEAREQMSMSIARGMWDVELWYASGSVLTERYLAIVLEMAGMPQEGVDEAVQNLSSGVFMGQMEFRRRMREDYPCEPEAASKHGEEAMREHLAHIFQSLRERMGGGS